MSQTNSNNGKYKQWVTIAQQIGIPSLLLFMILWFLAVKVADPLIGAHVSFLQDQTEITKTQITLLTKIDEKADEADRISAAERAEITELLARQTALLERMEAILSTVAVKRKEPD